MTPNARQHLIFDDSHYVQLIEARGSFLRRFLPGLKSLLGLESALDAGCGVGFFSALLKEEDFTVQAFDGRESNIREARIRYQGIAFSQGDIEDQNIRSLGTFDLVLCFGLLYHLESPMKAIRNLHSLTQKVLLLESMCLPTHELRAIIREEPDSVDQSLTDLAFYSSEGSITKMLYRAGFRHIYRIDALPDHDEFRETNEFSRRRTVLLASHQPVSLDGLSPLSEPFEMVYPWQKPQPKPSLNWRLKRFFSFSTSEKYNSIIRHVYRKLPQVTLPMRLPFGKWWLARSDHISNAILNGSFESNEVRFVRRFLQPGMTVLDIGAHHGFYSLLSASVVGPTGRVFAFEPSPREFRVLRRHVKLNNSSNVLVQPIAIGEVREQRELFQVEESVSGCNSLRKPTVDSASTSVSVQVMSLDDWVSEANLDRIDFVKLDIEGGELYALRGAILLLQRLPRPVVLAEVEDKRTHSWGYPAREIVNFLERMNYRWFRILIDGSLREIGLARDSFDANLVAIPAEIVERVFARLGYQRETSK